jgi:sugar lactone lactonase YvrE
MKASFSSGGLRVRMVLLLPALAAAVAGCATQGGASASRGDILIEGTGVHPESVTSSKDGSLYTGSVPGIIYRAGPKDVKAVPFITPNAENGLRSTYGVLADDKQGRLWVCSVANSFGPRTPGPAAPSEVVAFDLKSGKLIGRWPFPGGTGTCNDIAIAADGTAYATDTPGGRIVKLPKGGNALEVVVTDDRLKGIDGLAFGADGALIINNVQKNELWRVTMPAAGKPALTLLTASRKMEGPDGIRSIGGNRFLQAEGTGGRITLVTVEGNNARIDVLREGLDSSPGVTLVGNTVYAVEGKIQYLFNPQFRGKDPGPFKAIAIPLPK